MADALASGASEGNFMGVQVPPRPRETVESGRKCFALLPEVLAMFVVRRGRSTT
jgi:hypothetical protein